MPEGGKVLKWEEKGMEWNKTLLLVKAL